jgi:hypothetical protein
MKSMLIGGGPVNAAVMLLDPSNLNGPSCFAAGVKIDFAGSLGQNDKRWRALGSGLGLNWTPGRPRGEAHNKKCTRVAGRAFTEVKVTPRQPGDFWPFASRKDRNQS